MERLWMLPGLLVVLGNSHWASCQVEVHQNQSVVTCAGQSGTITCRYQASPFRSLQWFRQLPGGPPASLLILVADGTQQTKEPNLTADLETGNRRSSLHIRESQLRDAATYFWGNCEVAVEQDSFAVALEGQLCRITCRYEALVLSSLQWFIQPHGKNPAFLLKLYQTETTAQSGIFTALLLPDKKLSYLHIKNSMLGEAASYFCAVETQ